MSRRPKHPGSKPKPATEDETFARAQEEFNQLSKIVEREYAKAMLAARDLCASCADHKFDEMLPGLKSLAAEPLHSAGRMALDQVMQSVTDGWFPLLDDRFPIDGAKRDRLRQDFAEWLADGDKCPAAAESLLYSLSERLEGKLFQCTASERETLFTLVRATGAPLLDRKLAEAGVSLTAAKAQPDREIYTEGGALQSIIPGGALAAAQRAFDNLAGLKKDYDGRFPPAPKQAPRGPSP
jgi:hypothetical protein